MRKNKLLAILLVIMLVLGMSAAALAQKPASPGNSGNIPDHAGRPDNPGKPEFELSGTLSVTYAGAGLKSYQSEAKGPTLHFYAELETGDKVESATLAIDGGGTVEWSGKHGAEYADLSEYDEPVYWHWVYTASGILTISDGGLVDDGNGGGEPPGDDCIRVEWLTPAEGADFWCDETIGFSFRLFEGTTALDGDDYATVAVAVYKSGTLDVQVFSGNAVWNEAGGKWVLSLVPGADFEGFDYECGSYYIKVVGDEFCENQRSFNVKTLNVVWRSPQPQNIDWNSNSASVVQFELYNCDGSRYNVSSVKVFVYVQDPDDSWSWYAEFTATRHGNHYKAHVGPLPAGDYFIRVQHSCNPAYFQYFAVTDYGSGA